MTAPDPAVDLREALAADTHSDHWHSDEIAASVSSDWYAVADLILSRPSLRAALLPPDDELVRLREFANRIALESIPHEWGPGAQRHRRHVLRLLDDALTTTPDTAFANGRAIIANTASKAAEYTDAVSTSPDRALAALLSNPPTPDSPETTE